MIRAQSAWLYDCSARDCGPSTGGEAEGKLKTEVSPSRPPLMMWSLVVAMWKAVKVSAVISPRAAHKTEVQPLGPAPLS